MNKLIKITKTPSFFTEIKNDGGETIWAEVVGTILEYENSMIRKGEPLYLRYFRKLDESLKDVEGVTAVTTYDPADFKMVKHYFQEIPVELSLAEKHMQELVNSKDQL